MHKRKLHHYWRFFKHLKARYFLIAAVLCVALCVVALRHNNQHMAQLRQAVYTADRNDGDVQSALNKLQAYVTAHMNTNLSDGNTSVYPPVQLQYTYERLQQAQLQSASSTNSSLYTDAENYCQKQNSTDFSGRNRVPCVEQYVQDHGTKTPPAIPTSLYQFAFISPVWSPDLAGWSMVLSVVFGVLTIVTFFVQRHLKKLLQ